jgi:hypothetical protein
MGAKIQAFDIFQTPLSSHYPLPLRKQAAFYALKWQRAKPKNAIKAPKGQKSKKELVYIKIPMYLFLMALLWAQRSLNFRTHPL